MTVPRLVTRPLRNGLCAGEENTVHVLVRVQAPESPADAADVRPPVHLSLVLDRSGSMHGRPLEEARRCAKFVIDRLQDGDHASIVAYDDKIDTMVPLLESSNKSTLRAAIDSIRSGGTTDLHGGWMAGAESLASATTPDTLSRVILLSDGCANTGVTDNASIFGHCAELAQAGVSTSTYGLGHHFNEDLMVGIAKSGLGNAYYGETANDLMDPFVEEFSFISALFARNLELELSYPPGIRAKLLNDYASSGPDVWRLPELAYGSEAWAVVELTVPPQVAVHGNTAEVLKARVRFSDLESNEHRLRPSKVILPAVPNALYGELPEDDAVSARISELAAANMQDRARTAARHGDWKTVDSILLEAGQLVKDHPWLLAVLKEMRQNAKRRNQEAFSKEARYSARRMRTRLCVPDEVAPELDASVPEFMRRKMAQGRAEGPKE